jgi:hypothetical protein
MVCSRRRTRENVVVHDNFLRLVTGVLLNSLPDVEMPQSTTLRLTMDFNNLGCNVREPSSNSTLLTPCDQTVRPEQR